MRAIRKRSSARSHTPSRLIVVALTAAIATGGWGQGPVQASARGGSDPGRVAQSEPGLSRSAQAQPRPVTPRVKHVAIPRVNSSGQGLAAAAKTETMAEAAHSEALVAHVRAPLDDGASVVGITWASGSDATDLDLQVRTRDSDGWTPWSELEFDPDEGPAPDEEAETRDGTSPAWVGDADTIEVAVYSPTKAPGGLRIETIDPGTSSYDGKAASDTVAGDLTSRGSTGVAGATSSLAGTFPSMPEIVTRPQWGADESLGDACFSPRLGTTFKMVFVHHTVNSNDYTRAESAAIVRGIYAYHTQSRGWCDIGYNFLVDRYGTTYEGRAGGIRKPVRGAHAGDYNVDTTGISLIGNFENARATASMKSALVDLVAWRMGTAYHGAYRGAVVEGKWFARISGHRDAMSTACPGQRVYDWLPRLRQRVAYRLGDHQTRIEQKWLSLGGGNSSFGSVRTGERRQNQGHHTNFEHGRMYSSRAGVYALRPGPILRRYVSMGETGSDLRYPASGVRSPRDGYAADFQGGAIYWSDGTGSIVLPRSAVLQRYRAEHGAFGPLGFPTTGLKASKDSAVVEFEYGTIAYDKTTRRFKVTYE